MPYLFPSRSAPEFLLLHYDRCAFLPTPPWRRALAPTPPSPSSRRRIGSSCPATHPRASTRRGRARELRDHLLGRRAAGCLHPRRPWALHPDPLECDLHPYMVAADPATGLLPHIARWPMVGFNLDATRTGRAASWWCAASSPPPPPSIRARVWRLINMARRSSVVMLRWRYARLDEKLHQARDLLRDPLAAAVDGTKTMGSLPRPRPNLLLPPSNLHLRRLADRSPSFFQSSRCRCSHTLPFFSSKTATYPPSPLGWPKQRGRITPPSKEKGPELLKVSRSIKKFNLLEVRRAEAVSSPKSYTSWAS
ncbi:unnamed protein product [Urochloa humidicola]